MLELPVLKDWRAIIEKQKVKFSWSVPYQISLLPIVFVEVSHFAFSE